jgi:hypothetical protein
MAKRKPKEETSHKVVQHLDDIKKDVMALKTKISKTRQSYPRMLLRK